VIADTALPPQGRLRRLGSGTAGSARPHAARVEL